MARRKLSVKKAGLHTTLVPESKRSLYRSANNCGMPIGEFLDVVIAGLPTNLDKRLAPGALVVTLRIAALLLWVAFNPAFIPV
jgi:hypothetical protein